MKAKHFIAASLCVLLIHSFVWAVDTYKVDRDHAAVGFAVKHLLIYDVRGNFEEFEGAILLDDKDIAKSSFSGTIKTASINTGHQQRDEHLRSSDFLAAEQHPEITFRSTQIKKVSVGYIAIGILTSRGVSREIELPFTVFGPVRDPWGNHKIGVQARLTVNRLDYGVSWNKSMDNGGLVVANEVEIEIAAEAIKQ